MAEPQKATNDPALATLIQDVHTIAETTRASRQLKYHEIKHDTPWNPTGAPKPKLKWSHFYQNDARINPSVLSAEEITLINQLKPGLYNKKKWVVTKTANGGINLGYSNKEIEQRMEIVKESGGSLTSWLQKILIEQESIAERRRKNLPVDDDDDY